MVSEGNRLIHTTSGLAAMSPSLSAKSNHSLSPPIWLTELHTKLWGKRQLFDDIFRTVTLIKAGFIQLQQQLHSRNPERNSNTYVAQNVLAIKAEFLRSRSSADSTAIASHIEPNDNLVPKLVFNTTHDVSPTGMPSDTVETDEDNVVDTASTDTAAVHANTTDADPDPVLYYIKEDVFYLSTRDTPIFPSTIRYMDLRVLELTHFTTRIPQLMFLRKEWDNMVDIFNKREKGIRKGAVFTGQPGIGEVVLSIGLGKCLHGTSVALANQEISSHLLSI